LSAPRIVIIADDLTGALDCAAPFAKRGLVTRVAALPATGGAAGLRDAQVVAINTESRHLDAATAAAAVRRAVIDYADRDTILFKKVDSTLRGNVASETVAALEASGRRTAIFAPAFPAQGRVTRGGVMFVHGVPLAQTEFVNDALSPAPRAPIAQFMASAAPQWTIRVAAARDLQAALAAHSDGGTDRQLCIVDAETQQDLRLAISSLRDRLSSCLLVGSAGLSTALVDDFAGSSAGPARTGKPGLVIFIVGSRSQKSREQAAALMAAGAHGLEAPNGEVNTAVLEAVLHKLPAQANLLILATQPSGTSAPADLVAQRLAQLCVDVLRRCKVSAVVATGGDTAKAILEITGNPIIRVDDELMPGIALASFGYDNEEYAFVTKAGGFGSADTFIRIGEACAAVR
jgi:4-hydroxythreonine-4-phosphate dehydrogenase